MNGLHNNVRRMYISNPAFCEGFAAYFAGTDRDGNPHTSPEETGAVIATIAWAMGYDMAQMVDVQMEGQEGSEE